ncbi:MAG: GNAT family N-acetyltransferase [Thermoplasmataceae archaeon]
MKDEKKMKIEVRDAEGEDLKQFLGLIERMKRLNGEFDSLFTIDETKRADAEKFYGKCIEDKENYIVIIAEYNKNVVGVLKAEIRKRIYYNPDKEARIVDFYIMPEYRRKKVGGVLLDYFYVKLEKLGIEIVTAEFPALNLIALNFYKKIGYRNVSSIMGTRISLQRKK